MVTPWDKDVEAEDGHRGRSKQLSYKHLVGRLVGLGLGTREEGIPSKYSFASQWT